MGSTADGRSTDKTDEKKIIFFTLCALGWATSGGGAIMEGVARQNTYEDLKISFAKTVNVTNCWVCSQIMTGGSGFPWRVIPLGWAELCAKWTGNGQRCNPRLPEDRYCAQERKRAL